MVRRVYLEELRSVHEAMTTSTTEQETNRPEIRAPLSRNQEFLCMFDQGDADTGPFGPKYNIVYGYRVHGEIDVSALQAALDDTVARHEALRTRIVREDGDGYQLILPPRPAQLQVRDLSETDREARELRAEELLIEIEMARHSAQELPLLRAVLGRFDDHDWVLGIAAHHSAADAWSMQVIIRDLAGYYTMHSGQGASDLPQAPQYRDYTVWERARTGPSMDQARAYWRNTLRNGQILALPTDYPRSANLPKETTWHRFSITDDLTAATAAVAKSTRSSPFMVLLAAYKVLLHRMTGATDLVVMTFTSGRLKARFHNTVGSFFNFIPLRTDISSCTSFNDVLKQTRASCLGAYANDIPFADILDEAPELMESAMGDSTAICAFQVYRAPLPHAGHLGAASYSEIRKRLVSQPVGGEIPNGALWHLDLDFAGDMAGRLGFNTNLFAPDRMHGLITQFDAVLRETLTDLESPVVGTNLD